ncbi:MAG: fatty acid--CoA ligase [Campylobacterota bacterium]|nr:fatty acid--CoA ligase [Campylobacterota bacterium]
MLDYKLDNFYQMLEQNKQKFPKKPIIFCEGTTLNNTQLIDNVDILARHLELGGIKPGDKIALILSNSVEFIISFFAVTRIGAVCVPINNFLKREELEFILNDCEARWLFTSNKFLKEVKSLQKATTVEKTIWCDDFKDLDESNFSFDSILNSVHEDHVHHHNPLIDDLAVIVYTSGTTGKPKGAMLSYKNIFSNVISANKRFEITQKDRFVVYLPMFHSFTLSIMVLLPFYSASAIVILKSVFPFSNVLKAALLKRVTIFLGVPTVYNALLKAKIPWYFMWFNKIRAFISGSAPLSEKAINDFESKFKSAPILEGYGLSECSPAVCINPLNKQKPLSVGIPLQSYEVKIVDEELQELKLGEVGEIIVQGDCVMQGYLNRPEATQETIINGWLKTGDLGKMDEDGYIYIVDRKKDLIISKGINIYPREIEEVIYTLDEVELAAVVGFKDEHLDEVPMAFVQLKEDHQISEKQIKAHLKKHLANFKVPKTIIIKDELPKNATGKVLKRVLKEEVQKGL